MKNLFFGIFICLLTFNAMSQETVRTPEQMLIDNVTGSVSDGTYGGFDGLVNGAGLNLYSWTHVANVNGEGMWLANAGAASYWAEFNFDAVYNVGHIYVWNHNQPNNLDRGLKNVRISYTSDGTTWLEHSSTFMLTQGTGVDGITYDILDLGGVEASSVRISAATVDGNYGSDYYGLSEVRFGKQGTTFEVEAVPAGINVALDAEVTVSSEYPDVFYAKSKMIDGEKGVDGWASNSEQTPWARLTWSENVVTSAIVLYGRPSSNEAIDSVTLTFSDGSSVEVGALPTNGLGKTVTFSERTITWVNLQVVESDGNAVGLTEFEVYGQYDTPTGLSLLQENKYVLYPNPVREELYIKNSSSDQVWTISDIKGKDIMKFKGEKLNAGHLAPGVYFIRDKKNVMRFVKM